VTQPAPEPAVLTRGLSKSYATGHLFWRRRRVALEGLDLRVDRGEVFGYLGPNGSGKTTTLKLLTGLLSSDAGEISILGHPLADRAWRFRVGYLPEHPYLYDYLTAAEYLDYVGRLFGMGAALRRERSRALLSLVGLSRSAKVPLRRYSKGMVQRAGLAQALMNDPELVFLDEPMSGLDPIGRRLVRNVILDLKKAGKTVVFSTHILSDAETLCDRVAVLKGGRLLDVGPLATILRLDVSHVEVLVAGVDAARWSHPAVRAAEPLGERLRLEVDEGQIGNVVRGVEQAGGRILSVQPIRQSLEDYFFKELDTETAADGWGGAD
jgi:ABC-2 type transport system ATP-binding protein